MGLANVPQMTCSVDSAGALAVGRALEAMLLVPVLRPMISGLEGIGDYELDLLAREIAANDRSGFSALVAAALRGRS